MDRFSLDHCNICPRNCGANRTTGPFGYCGSPDTFSISSIVVHRGEEPAISGRKGICNIFFTGCNLRCIYCQNHQISQSDSPHIIWDGKNVFSEIEKILDKGIRAVGFVSTSHVVPQILRIIEEIRKKSPAVIFVHNTSGYEKKETIKALEGLVDVYLPDFKYISKETAKKYSDAPDYPEIAAAAIKEMYRQKGSYLHTNEFGEAENGLLIRHLVLPGHADESIALLKNIAEEISTGVHISLMSQYYPSHKATGHGILGRELYTDEYKKVADAMLTLGFRNGWVQDEQSAGFYNPDFDKNHPFE